MSDSGGDCKPLKPEVNIIKLNQQQLNFNALVCHHQKGGDCWNKVGLTWTSNVLSGFDDNKVLKLQLVLLMIILVCRITS